MKIYYHLPGLFEFYELYKVFLPLFREHREYFYDWCDIGSIYGAPADCLWGGGRVGYGEDNATDVARLMAEFDISARLTFSNSLITESHLSDYVCNRLCKVFSRKSSLESIAQNNEHTMLDDKIVIDKKSKNGVIIYSDILLDYIKENYPDLYFVSTTTKCITDFERLIAELDRPEYSFVVPDFRLNKDFDNLNRLSDTQKNKVEFLCNECCSIHCQDREACYENVSKMSLGLDTPEHRCKMATDGEGYRFSKAMKNPAFIGIDDIVHTYAPMGFSQFKIEGRSLGSAMVFEMLLYYMVKPEYQIVMREEVYLSNSLDLY